MGDVMVGPFGHVNIDEDLLSLADQVCVESASLMEFYPSEVIFEIKKLQREVNASYTVAKKFKDTSFREIVNVFSKDFSEKTQFLDDTIKNHRHRKYLAKVKRLTLKHYEIQSCIEARKVEKDVSRLEITSEDIYSIGNALNLAESGMISEFKFTDIYIGSCTGLGVFKIKSDAEKLVNIFRLQHFLAGTERDGIAVNLFLDAMLYSNIDGYGMWHVSRGMYMNSSRYNQFMVDNSYPENYPKDLHEYIKFMLEICMEEITFMKSHLHLTSFHKNIQKHIELTRSGLLDSPTVPIDAELLLDKLLFFGELERGKVKSIIGKEQRSASTLIKELIDAEYIKSDTPRGNIRMIFGIHHFAQSIFPGLISRI